MSRTRSNPDYLNGVPELLILHLLSRRPMYGYEIVRAIEDATDKTLEFGEGCIYPVLHRLEASGSLAGRREVVGGRSRVVYRVTPSGKKKLSHAENQWRAIVAAVDKVLRGDEHERPVLA